MKILGAFLAVFMLIPAMALAQGDHAHSMHSHITENGFYLNTAVNTGFDETVENLKAALKEEGFGILTEIDFQATMKAKLDQDTPPHLILGACNPPFAWEAFEHEPWIGVIMPCNVVVREMEDGSIEVSVKNPRFISEATGNSDLDEIGEELTARVIRVLEVVSHK